MKRVLFFSLAVLMLLPFISNAQNTDNETKKFGVKFSGFIKNDFFYDSRQTVAAREGHFLLFPTAPSLDPDGEDLNAVHSLNFLSIQSRLTLKITGPDALGAKTSGIIEGAFFGHSNADVNGFRLRHAAVKLDWESTQLLFGQYWHLMFVPECFPGTISFNTGVPFQYFSRNPQIRITQKIGDNLKFTVMAGTQRDFASPNGYRTLSNTATPDMQAQILVKAGQSVVFGITGGFKQLLPRTETSLGYKAEGKVSGFTSNAFLAIDTKFAKFKLQGIFVQNAFDGLMIGGYAVKEISDLTKDYRTYTPINTMSAWADIQSKGANWQAGIFAGFSKNMGSFDQISTPALAYYGDYSRGFNIDYLYRISPRVQYNYKKFRIATELEYTVAAYATKDNFGALNIDTYGKITDSESVSNLRVLMSVYYFF